MAVNLIYNITVFLYYFGCKSVKIQSNRKSSSQNNWKKKFTETKLLFINHF